jgi:hypothetical protein
MTGNNRVSSILKEKFAMKTIASALIALSVLVSITAPASALDVSTFYAHQDRWSH